MDKKNVFIIIGLNWSKNRVIKDLRDEEYKHNFYFGDNNLEMCKKQMKLADEVWIFGNVEENKLYTHALKNNFDIWKMGK